jgi:apolipoprotein N-acyltransferase
MDSHHEPSGRLHGTAVAIAATAATAVLFYFGTGLAPIPLLAVVAPLPVLLLATRTGAMNAAVTAWFGYAIGTASSWQLYLGSIDVPALMGVTIIVGTSSVFMSAVLLFRGLLRRRRVLLAMLTAPAVWVGALHLVAISNPAGVQGTLATAQADLPLLLQIASITGAWGVDFVVLLIPATIAAVTAPGMTHRRRLNAAVLTAIVVVLALGYSTVRFLDTDSDSPSRQVALLALNKPVWGTEVATAEGRRQVADYAAQIEQLPEEVSVAVLPEGGFAADDASLSTLVTPLSRIASQRHLDIVVGLVLRTEGKRYNTSLAIAADGSDPVAYYKWHERGPRFALGHELRYLPGFDHEVALVNCGDISFADPVRSYAVAGAQLMLVPGATSDSNGWQASRTALLRGVENGMGVAWSAQRGALMASDAHGRVLADARTDAGSDAPFVMTSAALPGGIGPTIYTRLGDWFPYLCLVVTLVGLVMSLRPQPKRLTG